MPDPTRDEFLKKMIAEGTSDEDILATLKVYDSQHSGMGNVARHAEAVASGAGKGAVDLVGGYENWRDALPAIGDIAENIKSGAQSVGSAVKEFGKGSLNAARALDQALTPQSFQSAGKVAETVKNLDPAKGTEDPWEAWARRGTNVAGLLLGSRWGHALPPEVEAGVKGSKAAVPRSMAKTTQTGMGVPKGEIPAIPVQHSISIEAKPELPKPEVSGTSLTPRGPVGATVPAKAFSAPTGTYPQAAIRIPAFPENVTKVGPGMAERPAMEPDVRAQTKGGVKLPVAPEAASMAELTDLVKGGVQHDFQGRVHFDHTPEPPPAPKPAPFEPPPPEEVMAAVKDSPPHLHGSVIDWAQRHFGDDWLGQLQKLGFGKQGKGSPPKVAGTAEEIAQHEASRAAEGAAEKEGVQRLRAARGVPLEGPLSAEEIQNIQNSREPLSGMGTNHGSEGPFKSLGAAAANDFGPPHGRTLSLSEMVDKYGLEEAAKRAKMTPFEVKARLAAPGGAAEDVAGALRKQVGANEAGRQLGLEPDKVRELSGGGPSRLPARAVEAIKAADARYKATGETPPPGHAEKMARIKAEGGAGTLKTMLPLAGAGVGAVAAPLLMGGGEGDPQAPVGKAILGGLAGLGVGAGLANPRMLANLRAQLYLTGGAIPKNVAAAVGNTGRAMVEGSGVSRLAPLKEALRLPTNIRTYIDAIKGPEAFHGSLEKGFEPFENTGSKLRYIKPTQHIGAIDKTAMDLLRRAGVSEEDLTRYFLTADRNVFKEISKHMGDLEGPVNTATRITHPFQRIPTNVVAEGFGDAAHMYKRIISRQGIDGRTAMTLASFGGGELLGKWAGNDPKKQWLASIALAAMGPSTAIGTLGAIHGVGKSGLGSGAFGGLSPIADIGFDILNQARPKNWFGFKPAAVTAAEKFKK